MPQAGDLSEEGMDKAGERTASEEAQVQELRDQYREQFNAMEDAKGKRRFT